MGWHIFGFFWAKILLHITFSKRTKMFVLYMKSKVFFIQSEMGVFIKIESD